MFSRLLWSTLLAAAVVAAGGCSVSYPYATDAHLLDGGDAGSFVVLIDRESGTTREDIISPCPKTRHLPEVSRLFTLAFDLSRPGGPPVVSPATAMAPGEFRSGFAIHPAWTLRLLRERVGLPVAVALRANDDPRIVRVTDDLPPADAAELRRLGFRFTTGRGPIGLYYADSETGRWYFGFHSGGFGDEPGADVCCPARGRICHCPTNVDFRCIWDSAGCRVVIPRRRHLGDLIPAAVTVWDYADDRVTTVSLGNVDVAALRPRHAH